MKAEVLYSELEDQLAELVFLQPLEKRDRSLQLIEAAIQQLEPKAEVSFYKTTLPRFLSLQYLEHELYHLQDQNRGSCSAEQQAYYRGELQIIQRFLDRHQWLYTYYRLGATELDQAYFLGGTAGFLQPAPFPGSDPNLPAATNYFALFLAYDMLRAHLLQLLDSPNSTGFIRPGRQAAPLRWTGSVIHAVELAYAIWLSDQVNHGEAELADIVHWLSSTLQIDLSRYTRLFVEIKARKRLSGTKFLDLLRDAVARYIDKGQGLRPAGRYKKLNAA